MGHEGPADRPDSSPLRRAFTVARAGRPGPVMREVPQDVHADEIDEDKVAYHMSPRDLAFGGRSLMF